jgi:hypothetical protein
VIIDVFKGVAPLNPAPSLLVMSLLWPSLTQGASRGISLATRVQVHAVGNASMKHRVPPPDAFHCARGVATVQMRDWEGGASSRGAISETAESRCFARVRSETL